MASLTRGISFRRQGSSGMSWTDTWSFNEDGVLVRTMKEEPQIHPQQRFGGSSLSRIHDSHDDDMDEACENEEGGGPDSGKKKGEPGASASSAKPTAPTVLRRSKSVGSAPNAAAAASKPQKSSSRFIKWLKKAFGKRKN